MYEPQNLIIQSAIQQEDGIGGVLESWKDVKTVKGYVDLITGTDNNFNVQKAITEDSTHVVILPEYESGIDPNMRIVDAQKRAYLITHVDDVMNIHHHLEIYCRFDEVIS